MANLEAIRTILTAHQEQLDLLAKQFNALDEQDKAVRYELSAVLQGADPDTYNAIMLAIDAARAGTERSVRYNRQAAILIRDYLNRIAGS